MSSNSASASNNAPNSLKLDEKTTGQQPAQSQLSGLEEDDEFEEFAVQGICNSILAFPMLMRSRDWDDSQTTTGDVKSSGDNLWEDNWDDDDIEDDFSVQLRSVLACVDK